MPFFCPFMGAFFTYMKIFRSFTPASRVPVNNVPESSLSFGGVPEKFKPPFADGK